jgi:hypothetical protein
MTRDASVDSGGSLSFDRYEANQVVQLIGVDDDENRFAGLSVTDRPSSHRLKREYDGMLRPEVRVNGRNSS